MFSSPLSSVAELSAVELSAVELSAVELSAVLDADASSDCLLQETSIEAASARTNTKVISFFISETPLLFNISFVYENNKVTHRKHPLLVL